MLGSEIACDCDTEACKGCDAAVQPCKMHDHYSLCPARQRHCPMCDRSIAASRFADHIKTQCKEYWLNCWKCSVPHIRNEVRPRPLLWSSSLSLSLS